MVKVKDLRAGSSKDRRQMSWLMEAGEQIQLSSLFCSMRPSVNRVVPTHLGRGHLLHSACHQFKYLTPLTDTPRDNM